MDRDLKESIEKLARVERLAEEEAMHGDNIAGAIEVNEDIEDKVALVNKLKKKLKFWTGIFVTGLVVLVIILLYVIYVFVSPKQEPEPVNQVVDKVYYHLDEVPITSIAQGYIDNAVATVDDLQNALRHTNAKYKLVDKLSSSPYRQADMPVGLLENGEYFYSSSLNPGVTLEDTILQIDVLDIGNIYTIYGDYDAALVEEIILDAWNENVYLLDTLSKTQAMGVLVEALDEEYGVDSVIQNDEGYYEVTDNGESFIPDKVTMIYLEESYIQYNTVALAYYYEWY